MKLYVAKYKDGTYWNGLDFDIARGIHKSFVSRGIEVKVWTSKSQAESELSGYMNSDINPKGNFVIHTFKYAPDPSIKLEDFRILCWRGDAARDYLLKRYAWRELGFRL